MCINPFVLLFVVIVSMIACKDDDPTLPPITSSGANTFGCRVDNKIYVPGKRGITRAEVLNDRIIVYGEADYELITLQIIDSVQPIAANKPYEFTTGVNRKCEYLIWTKTSSCLYGDAPVSGSITFTKIDRMNGILSGTFEFSAFSNDCNKSTDITDGRFDIRLDH